MVGTTDGKVHIVRGLKSGKPIETKPKNLGGSISGSPVKVDDNSFLVGADGADGKGKVMRFFVAGPDHSDFEWGWENIFSTPHGVPASLAIEGNNVYFSDKGSSAAGSQVDVVFYAVDKYTGNKTWQDPPRLKGFVNNSPAVGRKYAYYTLKRRAETGTGALVAVNKTNGEIGWVADLRDVTDAVNYGDPAYGNTSPLFADRPLLPMPEYTAQGEPVNLTLAEEAGWNVVLVGDTRGQLSAWIGEPENYGRPQTPLGSPLKGENTEPGMEGNTLRLAAAVYQDPVLSRNISGAAMELTPAVLNGKSILLAGANTADQSGIFTALEMMPFRDLKLGLQEPAGEYWPDVASPKLPEPITLKNLIVQPPGAERADPDSPVLVPKAQPVQGNTGDTATLNLLARLAGTGPAETSLQWFWLSQPGQKNTGPTVQLQPGVTAIPLSISVPTREDTLVIIINPTASHPHEDFLYNNYLAIPFKPLQQSIDLDAIISSKISWLSPGETYNQEALITSTSEQPITTELVWRVNGKQVWRVSITFTEEHTDVYKLTMPNGAQAKVEVEVNPGRDRPPDEPRWDNNRDSYVIPRLDTGDDTPPGSGGVTPSYLVE